MLKIIITMVILILSINTANTATLAESPSPNSSFKNKQIADLQKRFALLENNWGRFHLGGNITLNSNSPITTTQLAPEFSQQLDLFFTALIDPTLEFHLRLWHSGGWGINYQSISMANSPINAPLQINEAFLKYDNPYFTGYLGKFQFSLGPFGLISDFIANPVEGLALQKKWGNIYLTGLYTRVNTEYRQNTDLVESFEDYWALRANIIKNSSIFGFNLVPNGITGEKAFSFDSSFPAFKGHLDAEVGWYSFNYQAQTEYQINWTPGFLIGYRYLWNNQNLFTLKLGYFSPNFLPAYSSLGHMSGDTREWFIPNSKGLECFLQKYIRPTWAFRNRLAILRPVNSSGSSAKTYYHLISSLTKDFSPINQLELGIDIKDYSNNSFTDVDKRVFLQWNLRF